MVKTEVKEEQKRKIVKPKVSSKLNGNNLMSETKISTKPLKYKQTSYIKDNYGQPIFGISVNEKFRKQNEPMILAAVGGKYIWFYEVLLSNVANNMKYLDTFEDRDCDEDFYCCDWSYYVPQQNRGPGYLKGDLGDCTSGQYVVACAGRKGVIRIVAPNAGQTLANFEGHGEAVNEVKFHPRAADLLFSFSKDYTVRLWNVWTGVLVAVFGGCEGHRSEILHGDVDMTGQFLLSCGMDHTIKIWRIHDDQDLVGIAVAASRAHTLQPRAKQELVFPTELVHFPVFSSNKLHKNYIDCGRWFGRLVLSKSCDGFLSLWKPGRLDDDALEMRFEVGQEVKESVLHQFELTGSEIWYIRFDIDAERGLVAWGNRKGEVYIWDLREAQTADNSVFDLEPTVLNVGRSSSLVVRQTRFADSANILFCACDQGTIVRFDRI